MHKFAQNGILATEMKINSRATRLGTCEDCGAAHVALRTFIMQVLASQLPSLAKRNVELAVPPLFGPVSCIKIKA